MSRPRFLAIAAALVGATAAGSAVALTLLHPSDAAVPQAPPTTTARIVRTDLSNTTSAGGTLDYAPAAPIVNQLSGTYTALSAPGAVIRPGEALYRVDDLPVVLMTGALPAWRPFILGMTDGPDIGQLTTNLVASGNAAGLLGASSDHFDGATLAAVRRWQQSNNLTVTGEIPLGQVVFRTGMVRIGASNTNLGAPGRPGDIPYLLTTATPIVTVPLNPNLPPVRAGQDVKIRLPTLTDTTGTVFAVSPAPPPAATDNNRGNGNPADNASSPPALLATIIPMHPAALRGAAGAAVQVAFTTQTVNGVLAAPISALLALEGGGYGVEVVGPQHMHRLTAVTTGLFTGTQVEISGRGLHAGTTVVVAQ